MPIGGGATHYQDPERARRSKEETAARREYSVEEMSELLTDEEIKLANAHQLAHGTSDLLATPLPLELERTNPLGCIALKGNTIDFDSITDGTEDRIYEDEKLQEILGLPNVGDRGPLLRSRRSILGFLLLKDISIEQDVA